MRALQGVLIVGLLMVTVSSADAQINFAEDLTVNYYDSHEFSSTYSILDHVSQVEATPTPTGFTIKGDVSLAHDRFDEPQLDGFEPVFQLIVNRKFSVGPLPVRTHGALSEEIKAVLANGSDTAPQMQFRTFILFFVEDGGYPFINPMWTFNLDTSGAPMVGNNFEVFNRSSTGSDYILGPGLNYSMEYRIEAWINNAGLADTDAPPVLTFEFGGVSSFDGIEASAIGVIVPEPSTGLLAIAGIMALTAAAQKRRKFRPARVRCNPE